MIFTIADASIQIASFFLLRNVENEDFYIVYSIQYSFYLASLQSWIYSMRYLKSATNCCLTPTCFTEQLIKICLWTGVILYTVLIVGMWVLYMLLYAYKKSDFAQSSVLIATRVVWAIMAGLSTFFSGFAILQIFKTIRTVQKNNSSVGFNKCKMVIHCLLQAIQTLVVVLAAVPNSWFQHEKTLKLIAYSVLSYDLMIQLTVCYICITMGSTV